MTKLCNSCEYLKFCARSGIEDVGCDRYKRDTTTNEEWLKQCDTEQFATFLAIVQYDGTDLTLKKNHIEKWVEWLKEKHE